MLRIPSAVTGHFEKVILALAEIKNTMGEKKKGSIIITAECLQLPYTQALRNQLRIWRCPFIRRGSTADKKGRSEAVKKEEQTFRGYGKLCLLLMEFLSDLVINLNSHKLFGSNGVLSWQEKHVLGTTITESFK